MASAWRAFCSTRRTAVPRPAISRTVLKTLRARIGDSPSDGSSSMRTFGSDIRARPIASICCSPPESVPASCIRRSASLGNSLNTPALRSLTSRGCDRTRYPPRLRFSSTVRMLKMRLPSGTWLNPMPTMTCASTPSRLLPPHLIEPLRARSSPDMARSVVVLPAPLLPRIATIWPGSASREIPLRASMLP